MLRVIKGVFGLGLCMAVFGITASGASAEQAPLGALEGLTVQASPLIKADYQDYCVRQYFKCRNYSDTTYEFRRCMTWRGCWEAYRSYRERHEESSCQRWRNICSDRWGHGSGDYYGCMRYHGCN